MDFQKNVKVHILKMPIILKFFGYFTFKNRCFLSTLYKFFEYDKINKNKNKKILAMCAVFFDPLSHRENDKIWAYKTFTVMANYDINIIKALYSPERMKNSNF